MLDVKVEPILRTTEPMEQAFIPVAREAGIWMDAIRVQSMIPEAGRATRSFGQRWPVRPGHHQRSSTSARGMDSGNPSNRGEMLLFRGQRRWLRQHRLRGGAPPLIGRVLLTSYERNWPAVRRRLQVVAPPGSGKTVLGLYVWSDLVRKPALVLQSNSSDSGSMVGTSRGLFELDGREDELGTDGKNPGLLTST